MNELYQIDGTRTPLCAAHSTEDELLATGGTHIIHLGQTDEACARCPAKSGEESGQ